MSAQDPIHAPRHRRGRLNPFLRKPLWVILEEDDGCNRQSTPHDDVAPNDNDNYNEPSSSLGVEMTTTTTRRRNNPPRHLTLFDLVSIGVGGTVGSGIFVLNGLIARDYAGPATSLSWTLSGMAAMLSGCCYAELSGRIPVAGSSYAYAFVALGELPAFVTAGMLTLEFLLSGSAVAR
jgi:amino acid permease